MRRASRKVAAGDTRTAERFEVELCERSQRQFAKQLSLKLVDVSMLASFARGQVVDFEGAVWDLEAGSILATVEQKTKVGYGCRNMVIAECKQESSREEMGSCPQVRVLWVRAARRRSTVTKPRELVLCTGSCMRNTLCEDKDNA
jgi:hypothetical protein